MVTSFLEREREKISWKIELNFSLKLSTRSFFIQEISILFSPQLLVLSSFWSFLLFKTFLLASSLLSNTFWEHGRHRQESFVLNVLNFVFLIPSSFLVCLPLALKLINNSRAKRVSLLSRSQVEERLKFIEREIFAGVLCALSSNSNSNSNED